MATMQPRSRAQPQRPDRLHDGGRTKSVAPWSTAWIDWVAAGLYFGLSTQFSQRAVDGISFHLALSALVAVALLFRTRFPRWVLVMVAVLTAVAVLIGFSAEPLIAVGWATAACVSARPPRPRRGILVTLAVLAAMLVFFMGGNGGAGFNWGQWIVLSFLCVAAGIAFGSNAATTREAVEAALRMRAENALQEERLRIAREIHDVSSHTLVSIGVQASVAATVDREPAELRRSLQAIEVYSKQAARDIRHYLAGLRADDRRSETGSDFGARLQEIVSRARSAGVRCNASVSVDGRVGSASQEAVCRALEESLTNVAKHTGGSSATVNVRIDEASSTVELVVDDRGPGFSESLGHVEGFGLLGMGERVSALGGTLDLGRSPDGGARVSVSVPIFIGGRA